MRPDDERIVVVLGFDDSLRDGARPKPDRTAMCFRQALEQREQHLSVGAFESARPGRQDLPEPRHAHSSIEAFLADIDEADVACMAATHCWASRKTDTRPAIMADSERIRIVYSVASGARRTRTGHGDSARPAPRPSP